MSGTHDARDSDPAKHGTVLGFDFGTRKIGVAVGNTITGSARALTTLRESSPAALHAAIGALIVAWSPVQLVAGRPLHADGSPHAVTALADRFATELAARFGLPVEQVDERYTTQVADIGRAGARRGGADPGRDARAAAIILQAWLDARPRPAAEP